MSLLSKLVGLRDRVVHAIETRLMCAWCRETVADCVCDPDVDWVDPEGQ